MIKKMKNKMIKKMNENINEKKMINKMITKTIKKWKKKNILTWPSLWLQVFHNGGIMEISWGIYRTNLMWFLCVCLKSGPLPEIPINLL